MFLINQLLKYVFYLFIFIIKHLKRLFLKKFQIPYQTIEEKKYIVCIFDSK